MNAAHRTRTPPPRLIVAVLAVAVLTAGALAAVAVLTPSVIAPGLVALGARRQLAIAVGALGLLIPLLTIGGLLRATLELARRFSFWATLPAFRSTGVAVLALATAGASTAAWLVVGSGGEPRWAVVAATVGAITAAVIGAQIMRGIEFLSNSGSTGILMPTPTVSPIRLLAA